MRGALESPRGATTWAMVMALGCAVACAPLDEPACPTCTPSAFPAGTTPNDVVLSRCGAKVVALVADSGEARLHAIAMDDGAVLASTVFDVEPTADGDRFATPWAVAATPDGFRAAVTLFGQDRVAWVDPCAGDVLSTTTVSGAVTPQPVVITGERILAAFTNVRSFSFNGEAPQLDPGLLASFTVHDDVLTVDDTIPLPCRNPQGMSVSGAELVVSCSGPLARGPDGGQAAVDDGAVLRLDRSTLAVTHHHPAGRLAPGTATIVGQRILAGSLVDPRLLSAQITDVNVADTPLAPLDALPGVPVDALFETVPWDEHTALVTRFSTDTLLMVHVAEDVRVTGSIAVGPGGDAFRGLLAVDVRRDLAGAAGTDAVALLALSAEVVPLQLERDVAKSVSDAGAVAPAADEDL